MLISLSGRSVSIALSDRGGIVMIEQNKKSVQLAL